jgi:hypothetical protein
MHRSFYLSLLGLTTILAGGIFLVQGLPFFQGFKNFMWISLAFLALSTLVTYYFMIRAMAMKGHKNFVTAFGIGFALKSLGALAFLCYFIYIDHIPDNHFILPFFFMYFTYTAMLVWQVWQQSKAHPLP